MQRSQSGEGARLARFPTCPVSLQGSSQEHYMIPVPVELCLDPERLLSCQQESDCSSVITGDCGVPTCTEANKCDVEEDPSLCAATGCGVFLGSCSGQIGGPFLCNYVGNSNLCACGQDCILAGLTYVCFDVFCFPPNILDYCDESTGFTCHSNPLFRVPCIEEWPGSNNCFCHGCVTCPTTTLGGSLNIGEGICIGG